MIGKLPDGWTPPEITPDMWQQFIADMVQRGMAIEIPGGVSLDQLDSPKVRAASELLQRKN